MGTIWHSELVHSFIRWAHLATYCHIKAMMYVQVHYYVANSTGDMSMTVRSITWCVALIVRCTNFSIRLSKISSDLNKGAIKLIVATFKNAHIKHIHRSLAHSLATIHIAYKMGILTKFRFFFFFYFSPIHCGGPHSKFPLFLVLAMAVVVLLLFLSPLGNARAQRKRKKEKDDFVKWRKWREYKYMKCERKLDIYRYLLCIKSK